MSLFDYQPTHREHDVVRAFRNAGDGEMSVTELARETGIDETVVEATLSNLTTLGCVTETDPGMFMLQRDPVEDAFNA